MSLQSWHPALPHCIGTRRAHLPRECPRSWAGRALSHSLSMALVSRAAQPMLDGQENELQRFQRDVVSALEDTLRLEEGTTDTFRQNPRPLDTVDAVKQYYVSPFTEQGLGRPLEYRGAVRPFPPVIMESFSQLQISSYQGLFPEIHRAWVTVDNVIYIWDYLTEQNVCIIDALEQVVVSVGLARPNDTVFADFIKYVLVVATPSAVHLFALSFSDGTPEGTLDVRATDFSVATDGVIMKKIVGTLKGRIFLAGGDGSVFEVLYEHEGDSFLQLLHIQNKCRKLNITSNPVMAINPLVYLARSIPWMQGDTSELVDLVVDEARNILYSLSAKGFIQVYDLGADGIGTTMLKQTEDLFQKAEQYCRNNGIGSAQRYSQHNFRVLSIHIIPPTDSRSHHLLAVSDAGFRFYLETSLGDIGPSVRPKHLNVTDIRLPPQTTVWDELTRGDTEKKFFPPDWVSDAPYIYHHAFYSPGLLVLSESKGDSGRDHVVAFCEDGSSAVNEVVCELSPNVQSMDIGGRDVGRVRAIAEEPFIQFPITERDRELDQLRYLVATSATPDADQRRAGDGASAYANMIAPRDAPREDRFVGLGRRPLEEVSLGNAIVRTVGPWVTHLASRFGVALNENSQALTSSRLFVVLTTTGVHVVARVRPVDIVHSILTHRPSDISRLKYLEQIYGAQELCALLYEVAAQVPRDVGFPVGRRLLAHAGQPVNMREIVSAAKSTIRSWYTNPGMGRDNMGVFSGDSIKAKGLLAVLSRLIRPVWLKPLVVEENVPVAPLWNLFLQPPELHAVLEPLLELREVVLDLYKGAIQDPVTAFFNPPTSDRLDESRMEDVHVRALYWVLDRCVHALRVLLYLAEFWRENCRIRLPFDEIQAWTVADMVTRNDATQKVKIIMSQVLQPTNHEMSTKADELTRRLSTDAFMYFSKGDHLVFEARKLILRAKTEGIDSTDRRMCAEQAAAMLVQAAPYWRSKADVDALDGGLDRNNHRLNNDGLAMEVLKLAPNNQEVLNAVVDMCMLTAMNFKAKKYNPPNSHSSAWLQANTSNTATSARAKKEYESAAIGNLDEQTIVALRHRCFMVIIEALAYLTQPARRTMMGVGVPQAELTERAWSMLNRALFSRDYDFHRRLYDWLLHNGQMPDKENFFFSLPTSNESFILAYLDSIPDTAEKITRKHQYFTAHDRHADAMELMEKVAMDTSSDMPLDTRVDYLEKAKGSARMAAQFGSWESGARFVSEGREAHLNDIIDLARMQQRLRGRLQHYLQSGDREVVADLQTMERGLLTASDLYKMALKYSLWHEVLLIVNMCAKGGSMNDIVKVHWSSLIYDALPCRANDPHLQQWFESKAARCPKQWEPQGRRPVGKQVGLLDDPNLEARFVVLDVVKKVADDMGIRDGQPHAAFPLEYILEELLELEFQLDVPSRSRQQQWQHLAWWKLVEAGVAYRDLFRAHVEIVKRLSHRNVEEYRRHILDSVRHLTKRWWDQLQQGDDYNSMGGDAHTLLLDRSTQGFVVRQLEQLSSSQFGEREEIRKDLSELKKRFQLYPDIVMMDMSE